METGDFEQTKHLRASQILVQRLFTIESGWAPYFEAAAERDDEVDFAFKMMTGALSKSKAKYGAQPIERRSRPHRKTDVHGSHSSCVEFTGILNKCNACGKIEGKRGEWKTCSKCAVARYCGKDCQKADWKKHKKVCASLFEAARAN